MKRSGSGDTRDRWFPDLPGHMSPREKLQPAPSFSSFPQSPRGEGSTDIEISRWRNGFARLTALATFALIFAGGLVTSTGSSLAVPDWPLSYGMLFPPMVGGVLYEHGHRLIAGTVATMMLVLGAWTWRDEPRRWVRRLALAAVAAVFLQALLGGITVLFLLPTAVSVLHACLAQAFFGLVVTLALVTGRDWRAIGRTGSAPRSSVAALAAATTGAVYLQLVVGAVMRHTGAGLAIPDFPLAFGRLLPPQWSAGIAVHFAHRMGAVVVTALALVTAATVFRVHADEPRLLRPAALLVALVAVQITLGAATVLTRKAVLPTTAHVAAGAAILATSLVVALRAGARSAPASPPRGVLPAAAAERATA